MISRRSLRIRVFQFLFSYFKQDPPPSIDFVKQQCLKSLEKTYYFYLLILSLLDEMRVLETDDIERKKNKFIQKNTEFTPFFTIHPFLITLKEHKPFYQKITEYKVNFGNDKDWIYSIYRNFRKSELFQTYQESEKSEEHLFECLEMFITDYLYHNELLEHFFEEQSQFAQEDLYISLNFVIKNIEEFQNNHTIRIFNLYKDEKVDKKFVEELIQYTIQNFKLFDSYIQKYSENWDLDRINYTDLLLLKMCLVELIYFPDIPLKTSVDEYIEISKDYSTSQSYIFINGILVGLIKDLTENGMIQKTP
ncbi:MAG: N utilization substance protein B [Bacteroidia bacterium]|nr:MAG: N utilization substance protein B [Bacteroidia bacterium]